MSAIPESQVRTRAFSRVIGPWLAIVPGIILVRAPDMGAYVSGFFENPLVVWFTGALLLFMGLLIIAFHPYWSSLAAVLISLFGWFLALRGIGLLVASDLFERVAAASAGAVLFVRLGFGLFVVIGLYLTYVGWFSRPSGPG